MLKCWKTKNWWVQFTMWCKSRSKYSRQLTPDWRRHWLYFIIGPILVIFMIVDFNAIFDCNFNVDYSLNHEFHCLYIHPSPHSLPTPWSWHTVHLTALTKHLSSSPCPERPTGITKGAKSAAVPHSLIAAQASEHSWLWHCNSSYSSFLAYSQ